MNLARWSAWIEQTLSRSHSRFAQPKRDHRNRPRVECLERRTLLAAMVDLTAYRPDTPYIDFSQYPVAETVEEDPQRGPGIRINGDDDNGNAVADFDDPEAGGTENDLVRLDVSGSGQLELSWDEDDDIAVWASSTKGLASKIDNGGLVEDGQSLWVEYVGLEHSDDLVLTLAAVNEEMVTLQTDTVRFHTFESLIVAIGGNSQDPADFGDARLGVFNIAGTLYQQGYDVTLHHHADVGFFGQGAAYDEVSNAVLERNVDQIAVIGYSWGSTATYYLSRRLANDADLAGECTLAYTASIDGIRRYWISPERRLPVGTEYHDNIYQRRSWLLRGDRVAGADTNINVSIKWWGRSLRHTTIDDSPIVQGIIVHNLTSRVAT